MFQVLEAHPVLVKKKKKKKLLDEPKKSSNYILSRATKYSRIFAGILKDSNWVTYPYSPM